MLVSHFITLYYALLMAGFFFLDKSDHRNMMYAGIPLLVYFLYRKNPWRNRTSTNQHTNFILPIIFCVGGYALLHGISVFWSTSERQDEWFQSIKLLLLLPLFLAPFALAAYNHKDFWPVCLSAFVLSGVIASMIIIPLRWDILMEQKRLYGWGSHTNPVACGLLYGLTFLCLLFCKRQILFLKSLPLPAYAALSLFPGLALLLTQSRGPFVATCATILAVLLIRGAWSARKIFIAIVGLSLLCAAFIFYGSSTFSRGTTGRSQIWLHALSLIQEKPFLGHGSGSEFIYPFILNGRAVSVADPHSLYLSTLVHTGLLGFFFLLSALVTLLVCGAHHSRNRNDHGALILIVFGAVMGLVDFGGYYRNLDITWLVFWFPAAFLAVRPLPIPAIVNSQQRDLI